VPLLAQNERFASGNRKYSPALFPPLGFSTAFLVNTRQIYTPVWWNFHNESALQSPLQANAAAREDS
jgi:hypothetical protein